MPRRIEASPYALKVGQRLRALRLERNMSLAELADAAEVSKGHADAVPKLTTGAEWIWRTCRMGGVKAKGRHGVERSAGKAPWTTRRRLIVQPMTLVVDLGGLIDQLLAAEID